MAGATARPVRDRRGLRAFVELPYLLHGDDPHFVPPLRGECRWLLDRRRNPFFAYGDAELFTVTAGGRVAGRVAAVHNPRHNAAHGGRDGFFGQFACADDPAVAAALLGAAARWARERGLTSLAGPVNFTMNDECGLLVDGFGERPAVMMPYNPPYYRDLLEGCGLRKAKDLWAWRRGPPSPRRAARPRRRARAAAARADRTPARRPPLHRRHRPGQTHLQRRLAPQLGLHPDDRRRVRRHRAAPALRHRPPASSSSPKPAASRWASPWCCPTSTRPCPPPAAASPRGACRSACSGWRAPPATSAAPARCCSASWNACAARASKPSCTPPRTTRSAPAGRSTAS
ncbi:hypothetical protein [Nonomuraea salmonea]|uniref:hypothetical protein n=1 Tax=Nonomuraea salmonea TaxID=46181 RepID=UPI0031ECF908